ncbi:ribbon-helix-helix protein, CopG family [Halovulum sp. GXIMD14794]
MPVVVNTVTEDFDRLIDRLARKAGVDRATIIRRAVALMSAADTHGETHGHLVLSRTPVSGDDIEIVDLFGPQAD